ncbi:MAG: response regulator [Candidatus Levybacteria bacterium]|nr:response regulator [Candidatus Levybacteria bacterium]MBP9815066.1 response regulator [Candidatus Levybacteria bacterium]
MEEKTDKRVLIVDDDTEFIKEFSQKIETQGLQVHSAITPKEALDYIAQNEVDFIILDFVMPEMDGYSVYHIINNDMRKNIPTIILTNFPNAKDMPQDLEIYVKSETNLNKLAAEIKMKLSSK